MDYLPQLLLIGAVIGVGVLHTLVPDHWAPIMILARQQGWSKGETAKAALRAGIGHVVSTLVLGVAVWVAGAAVAVRFGTVVSTLSSLLLIGFGLWMALSAWRGLHQDDEHGHDHDHGHGHHHEHQHGVPHEHGREASKRTALLLILGSSPMVEGIPAFFAAGKYGTGLILLMALCFGISTVVTYVAVSVYSTATLRRLRFTALERHGEVLSGVLIALVGAVFMVWSVW